MKNKKGFLCVVLTLMLLFSFSVSVYADSVDVLTEEPTDYYLDVAGILSEETKTEIAECNAGLTVGEIYIVTVTGTGTMTIGEYANAIYDAWDIGGTSDTGLLLLINMDSDEDGSGQENYYTIAAGNYAPCFDNDALETMHNNYVEPSFAIADYDSAVSYFITQAVNMVSSVTETVETTETQGTSVVPAILKVISVILIIIIILATIAVVLLTLINARDKKIKALRKKQKQQKSRLEEKFVAEEEEKTKEYKEFADYDLFADLDYSKSKSDKDK